MKKKPETKPSVAPASDWGPLVEFWVRAAENPELLDTPPEEAQGRLLEQARAARTDDEEEGE